MANDPQIKGLPVLFYAIVKCIYIVRIVKPTYVTSVFKFRVDVRIDGPDPV